MHQKLHNCLSNVGVSPMLTDKYQLSMTYLYYKQGKVNDHTVFDTFFRKNPFKGEFCVFAGLSDVLQFVQDYKWQEDHIQFASEILGEKDKGFEDYLRNIDCKDVEIQAIKEGSLVFPKEICIRLEGPLGIIQLLETTILNLVNFSSLIATNARRLRIAAGNDVFLSEFGLRRAQGPAGGLFASKYAVLGGFDSTSNVFAAYKYGLKSVGTMAHSFICTFSSLDEVKTLELNNQNLLELALKYREQLGFNNTNDSELAAFIAYAHGYPNNCFVLVDTFNTIKSGVPNFILVSLVLRDLGYKSKGFRLDSGDLPELSKQARALLIDISKKMDYENLAKSIIIASDGINEDKLIKFKEVGNEMNGYGIGTHLVTCQKQPALGMVYKLVEINKIKKIKFTSNIQKATLPGKKTVYRMWNKEKKYPVLDYICFDNEELQTGKAIDLYQILSDEKIEFIPNKIECLLETVWPIKKQQQPSFQQSKQYLENQIQQFNPEVFSLKNPTHYPVYISQQLKDLLKKEFMKVQKLYQ